LALGTERSGLIDRGNERSDVLDQTLKHAGRASSLLVEGLGGENGEAGEHSVPLMSAMRSFADRSSRSLRS
jgi:hypothetical protein